MITFRGGDSAQLCPRHGHRVLGRHDAVVSDQTDDLNRQRGKGNQVNDSQRAQKKTAHQKMRRWFHHVAPQHARERGKKSPMARDEVITPFGEPRERRPMLVTVDQPLSVRPVRARAKNCFRSAVNRAVGLDQLHRRFKSRLRNFRKLRRHARILIRNIVDVIARDLLPSTDPPPAKPAVAVVNQQRLRRRRSHLHSGFHGGVISARFTIYDIRFRRKITLRSSSSSNL